MVTRHYSCKLFKEYLCLYNSRNADGFKHTPNIVGIIENVAKNAEQTPVMPPDPGVKHAAK